ncbi:hypothetical protein B0T10DRAFT_478583 [Thelonectria olida]|uniref:Uncharacterized protein n=1 Tax=Thelonectria olida TaxID=1576542 RepID=A0A9P8WBR9_9HYPO|nr:hypothetical protein B0T10DRAFT_478583 [Thelonectria olida]
MDRFPIIIQSGNKGIDHETLSQIKTHAMVTHLRQKAKRNAESQGAGISTSSTSPAQQSGHPGVSALSLEGSFRVVQFRPNKAMSGRIKHEPKIRRQRKSKRSRDAKAPQALAVVPLKKILSPPDVSNYCGSHPFDGIPPEISRRISQAFKHHIDSHAIESRCIHLPMHFMFTRYLLPLFFSSRAAFFAVGLKALLFDSVEREPSGNTWLTKGNLYYLRGRALQEINTEILTSQTMEDSTICATVCLQMFENAWSSSQGPVHLRGLQQMLLKRKPSPTIFYPAIACLDAIDAILRDCPLLLATQAPILRLRKDGTPNPTAPVRTFYPNSPLLFLFNVESSSLDSAPLSGLTRTLTNAFTLVDLFQAEVEISDGTELADRRETAKTRIEIYDGLIAISDSALDTVQGRLAEACKVAAWMHWRAVVGKVPHRRDSENAFDCAYLREILRETSIVDWMHMPYAYLWVLLTGAASSKPIAGDNDDPWISDARSSFFYSRLCQFMMTVGLRWWEDFGQILSNFCWLQAALRRQVA